MVSAVRKEFFFFQAEDGIRDIGVTGVQTCALPICYYDELSGALKGRVADDFGKYGVELVDFLIGAITPPEEVQKMIDERAGMGAIGDMNRYLAFKAARAVEAAASNPGETGSTAGLGLGAGIGMMMPQMIAQAVGAAARAPAPASAAPAQ